MKYHIIILTIAFAYSCGSSKQTIADNSTENKEQVAVVTEKEMVDEPEKTMEMKDTEKASDPKEMSKEEMKDTMDKDDAMEKDNTTPEAFDHNLWNTLLQSHVSDAGNVDYKAFKSDASKLRAYIDLLSTNMPNDGWSREDKLAYWINAYNALTVDLIIRNYPLNSIKDIKNPWDQRLWKLGEKWYNLNEIEHQILRKMDEPRIHFAIVCASFSCPKLQNTSFTASNLEGQLTDATKTFLADNNRNNISANSLQLSKIFKWFSKDFKTNGSVIDFIDLYTDVDISPNAKKTYKTYNWDLND